MYTETQTTTLNTSQLFQEQQPLAPVITAELSSKTYYRSRLFTANSGITPLVTAAQTILTLAQYLKTSSHYPNASKLHQHLSHEIKAFETRAMAYEYPAETILLARYILCACLDEIISNSAWGKENLWHSGRLLLTFHGETNAPERFFTILERVLDDAAHHLDILELIYLTLSLGFTGKYQDLPHGKEQLEQIKEKLYETIRYHRGDFKKQLFEKTQTLTHKTTTTKILPLSLLVALAGTLLMTVYIGFNYALDISSKPLAQQLQMLWN